MDRSASPVKYRALDAWRGICALLVVLFHLRVAGHFRELPFVGNGGQGVDFFFVLSGFVIAHAYGHRLKDWTSGLKFIVRRFGRLYPLHLFTLSLMVALELGKLVLVNQGVQAGEAPFTGMNNLPALLANSFLVNGLSRSAEFTWNGPSWSISTEFFTYVVFLGVALLVPRHVRLAAVAIAVAAVTALFVNELSPHPLSTLQGEGLMRCLLGFFLGTLVQRIYARLSSRLKAASWWEWAALAAALAMFAFVIPFQSIIAPIIFAGVVFVFAFERGPLSKLLLTPIPQHLGLISYSIYLMHYPAITLLNGIARALQAKAHVVLFMKSGDELLIKFGPPLLMDAFALIFVLAVIGASTLSYLWVEDPARKFFNQLSNRIGPRNVPVEA